MDIVTFSLENGTHIPAARTDKIFFFEILLVFSIYLKSIWLAGFLRMNLPMNDER